MPVRIIEYAQLSQHVYHISHHTNFAVKESANGKLIDNGWASYADVDKSIHFSNPCFAALYVKFHNRQATDAVIAIRGTQSFTDAKVDFDNRLAVQYVQHHFGLKF